LNFLYEKTTFLANLPFKFTTIGVKTKVLVAVPMALNLLLLHQI